MEGTKPQKSARSPIQTQKSPGGFSIITGSLSKQRSNEPRSSRLNSARLAASATQKKEATKSIPIA